MNDHFIKNYGATSRTSLASVDHASVIQTNLTRHKNAFFFVNKKTSNNEETLSNEEGPSVATRDDMPTNEESSDEEDSDEDTQCQECYLDIHKAQQFVVLHPCNCILHLNCIKDKFYEDPKCPKCNTDTMKARRMTIFAGRFIDIPLEIEYVKKCIKNRRIDHQMHQSSAQEGHSKIGTYSRVELVALRRLIYEKTMYCHSVRTGRALDSIEICKQIFRNDPNAKDLMRSWIRLEIQALKQITIVPDHGHSFENTVIATLQMENITEEQKKRKDYAESIIRNTLDDYTDLFLHSARAFLTSFCQTLEEWIRAVSYPEMKPNNSNTVTSPSTRLSRPGLKRSSGPSLAHVRSNSENIESFNTAQSIGTASPITVAQPVTHSVDQNVPRVTTSSSVMHLEHVPRSVTISSTSASWKSYPVLGNHNTRRRVMKCLDLQKISQRTRRRGLFSGMRSWRSRAIFSRSQLHSVEIHEADLQAILSVLEGSTDTLAVADDVEDEQTHGVEDASPTEVGRRKKLSRKFAKMAQSAKTSIKKFPVKKFSIRKSFIKKSSIKKSSKGLDWEKEQDIR
ncbi:uncharacterized protein EAE98_007329 [Botrytis deweyae]|uniref:RING-type domain-containing protein n=1 Tax=Botrytis deweyae TaxID=2478750 RepID=A0ABQ7IHB0_9HELO|nr:uncharacterized protein EAE98_007329 [Botrytis deweyae]KAF7924278.1 hypothetical protein EAE98_007329 [Botrytis deweyae]